MNTIAAISRQRRVRMRFCRRAFHRYNEGQSIVLVPILIRSHDVAQATLLDRLLRYTHKYCLPKIAMANVSCHAVAPKVTERVSKHLATADGSITISPGFQPDEAAIYLEHTR